MNSSNPTEYVKENVIHVVLPFIDQTSSESLRRQLAGAGSMTGRTLKPMSKRK